MGIAADVGTDWAEEESSEPALPLRTTYVIARLSRVILRNLEAALLEFDLTVPQFTTLSVLARRPGLSNAQLARRAYVTPQSMQEVLRALEGRGLVVRNPDPDNRRILRATLTTEGRSVSDKSDRVVASIEEEMLDDLSAEQSDDLMTMLRHCVHQLGGGL